MELVSTLPVDLGGGGHIERLPLLVTTIQHDFRAPDVGRDVLYRRLDDLPDAHRSGQMDDSIDLADHVLHHRSVQNGIDDQVGRRVVADPGEVVQAARGQVDDDKDVLAGLEQALH
jgi:hypothetical protein